MTDFLFVGSKISADAVFSHEIKRGLLLCDKPRQGIRKRHCIADKGPCGQAIFFPVVISGRESRVIEEAKKSWFFWIVVLGCHSCIESPLGSKEIKPINPKGNQPWIFISRTDAEAEAPILLPPDEKSWLIGKDPDDGKYWRQKKRAAEDEIGSITSSVDMNLSKLWEIAKDRGAWRTAVHGVAKSQIQPRNWRYVAAVNTGFSS